MSLSNVHTVESKNSTLHSPYLSYSNYAAKLVFFPRFFFFVVSFSSLVFFFSLPVDYWTWTAVQMNKVNASQKLYSIHSFSNENGLDFDLDHFCFLFFYEIVQVSCGTIYQSTSRLFFVSSYFYLFIFKGTLSLFLSGFFFLFQIQIQHRTIQS